MPDYLDDFIKLEKSKKLEEIIESYHKLEEKKIDIAELREIEYIVGKAYFYKANIENCIKITSKVNKWAEENNQSLYIKSGILLSNCYSSGGNYNKSLTILEHLLEQKGVEKTESYPVMLMNVGITHFYQGRLVDAKKYYLKALETSEERNLPQDKILNNLLICYSHLGQYSLAITTGEKVLQIKEKNKDWFGWAITNSNLAVIYSYFNDFEDACKMVEQAIKIAQEKLYLRILAGALSVKGLINIRQNNIELAEECLIKAKTILEETQNKDILPSVLVRLFYVYASQNYFDKTNEIIQEFDKLAEEQESYFLTIWALGLEAVQKFHMGEYHDSKVLGYLALEKALENKLYSVYFHLLRISCFYMAALEDHEELETKIEEGLKVAKEQNIIVHQVALLIAYALILCAKGNWKKSEEMLQRIQALNGQQDMFMEDQIILERYISDLKEAELKNESEKKKQEIMYSAYLELENFLERVNPWI